MTHIKRYNELLNEEHSDGRDDKVYVDENGDEWLRGEDGRLLKDENGDNIPPTYTSKKDTSSNFSTYDTSGGHCAFCGSIRCSGTCFK